MYEFIYLNVRWWYHGRDSFINMSWMENTDIQGERISDIFRFMNDEVVRVDLKQAVIYSEILNGAYVSSC